MKKFIVLIFILSLSSVTWAQGWTQEEVEAAWPEETSCQDYLARAKNAQEAAKIMPDCVEKLSASNGFSFSSETSGEGGPGCYFAGLSPQHEAFQRCHLFLLAEGIQISSRCETVFEIEISNPQEGNCSFLGVVRVTSR